MFFETQFLFSSIWSEEKHCPPKQVFSKLMHFSWESFVQTCHQFFKNNKYFCSEGIWPQEKIVILPASHKICWCVISTYPYKSLFSQTSLLIIAFKYFFLIVIRIGYTKMCTEAVENKIYFKVLIGFSNVKSRYMKNKRN